jgi:tetratricopeptide (TPR) repeat protein
VVRRALAGKDHAVARDVDGLDDEIARCDEAIAENRVWADPVARRRLAKALADKARALSKAGLHVRSAEVWQEAITLFWRDPPSSMACFVPAAQLARALALVQGGRTEAAIEVLDAVDSHVDAAHSAQLGRIQAEALALKSRTLKQLGQSPEACVVDQAIVSRFGGSDDGRVAVIVAYALLRLVSCRLDEARVSDALKLSDQLLDLFQREGSRDGRLALGEMLLSHLELLIRYRHHPVVGLAIDALAAAGRASVVAIGPVARRLGAANHAQAPAAPARRLLKANASALIPRSVHDRRRLAEQAVRVAAQLGRPLEAPGDAKLERVAATAKIYQAVALGALGHWRAANAIFNELAASGRSSTIEALSDLAHRSGEKRSALGDVASISILFMRARTLGQDDNQITKIALEESLREDGGTPPLSPLGKLVAKFYLKRGAGDSYP